MNIFWKGAAALAIAGTAIPAHAHDARHGYRYNDWRGDRWDRGDRRHYRGNPYRTWRGYDRHCWTEWRYSRYHGERVRVRICR